MPVSMAASTAWTLALLLQCCAALSGWQAGPMPLPTELGDAKEAGYHELYFDQALNHSDPASATRWRQRYLLGNGSWDGRGALPNGCRGPILLYAGNEGPVEGFWQGSGFFTELLAPRWGALLVFPEQRFYGRSMPCGSEGSSLQPACLRLLSTAQVLADYAALLSSLRDTLPSAKGCPAVAFGGSYGGTLAALLRISYPELVDGALASSAEFGYYDVAAWGSHGVSEFTFEDIVVKSFASPPPAGGGPPCLEAIERATEAVEAAAGSPEQGEPGLPGLAASFGVCEPRALGEAGHRAELFVYALENLPQLNYPFAISPLPAWPVAAACRVLLDATSASIGRATATQAEAAGLVDAAAAVTRLALGYQNSSACIPYQGPGGPGNTPGDGPGLSAWGWQSCTETLHRFSARTLRNYTFSYKRSAALCAELWDGEAVPDTAALARTFGGYQLAEGPSAFPRIIWSQGKLDPWHGWFRNMTPPAPGRESYHILMDDAAHHLDLKTPHSSDPPSVVQARLREAEIIHGWLRAGGSARPHRHPEQAELQPAFAGPDLITV